MSGTGSYSGSGSGGEEDYSPGKTILLFIPLVVTITIVIMLHSCRNKELKKYYPVGYEAVV